MILIDAGGEEGIRTLEKLLTSTPLAGERLRPLGHLSGGSEIEKSARTINSVFAALQQARLTVQDGRQALPVKAQGEVEGQRASADAVRRTRIWGSALSGCQRLAI